MPSSGGIFVTWATMTIHHCLPLTNVPCIHVYIAWNCTITKVHISTFHTNQGLSGILCIHIVFPAHFLNILLFNDVIFFTEVELGYSKQNGYKFILSSASIPSTTTNTLADREQGAGSQELYPKKYRSYMTFQLKSIPLPVTIDVPLFNYMH